VDQAALSTATASDFDRFENSMIMKIEQLGGQIVTMRRSGADQPRSNIVGEQLDLSRIDKLRRGVTTIKLFTKGATLDLMIDELNSAPVASQVIKNKTSAFPALLITTCWASARLMMSTTCI